MEAASPWPYNLGFLGRLFSLQFYYNSLGADYKE
jgi:hypothetical protein